MSARRVLLVFSILLLALVALSLVVISPWALPALDQDRHANWSHLSQIGATYGAISAVIAAIALTGVVMSLILQRHEALVARRSTMRALHVDLMKLAMDDPVYMECWGEYVTENFDTERQFTYVNLIVSHWHAMYEIGECTDAILHSMATELFSGEPGRRFWKIAGSGRIKRAQNRKIRRFYEIIEKAYREALTRLDA